MIWTFPRNEGGQESGFHDPGVETFKGNFDRYLAREAIQNSLDARRDPNKPVIVKFDVERVLSSQIPDLESLTKTFARCAEYWSEDAKAMDFFQKAEKLAKQRRITILRIGDYNTLGVIGGDIDRKKSWYTLIRCSGASSKYGGEGGSFGIGKNAPFAASMMRTVLYSTYNIEKENIFQGVARLVTHLLPNRIVAQSTGYLGGDRGESVRASREIPRVFLRREYGTDIVVLGFRADESWKDDLVYSVLENFWPAIHFGDLEVFVGGTRVCKENLDQLLEKFSGKEEFSAHHYYKAFVNPTVEVPETLPNLKEVSAYLMSGPAELPKKVAMVRKTGMVIYCRPYRAIVPFCGIFICRNEKGNRLLREMEPPRHDVWDPDHPEKGANRKIDKEFSDFIRECIRKLSPTDDVKSINIPDLNKYLPDDDESDEEFVNVDDATQGEKFEEEPEPRKVDSKRMDKSKKSMQPDAVKPGEGESETEEAGTDSGSGGGPGSGQNEVDGGGGSGGGVGTGGADSTSGSGLGVSSKPSVPVRFRTYSVDSKSERYSVCVEPLKHCKKEVHIIIHAVGDDTKSPAQIKSATLQGGAGIAVRHPGVIGPVVFPKSGNLKFEIQLQVPCRYSMEVSAHEA